MVAVLPEIEPMPENLLRAPIDFIFADHFRQLVVCNLLDALAGAAASDTTRQIARQVLGYFTRDLPHHIADEETDLFPLLRRRMPADAPLSGMVQLLVDEHWQDLRLAETLRSGLEALAAGRTAGPGFATAVAAFTATQRRHIAWENGVLLPEARARLGAEDLEAIGRAMAQRRGVDFPQD